MRLQLSLEDLVRAARVYAAEQVEWLAPALYAAPLVLSEQLPAPAAIDKWGRIYLNPRWLQRLQGDALPQLGFLLAHEVWHWLREHNARRARGNCPPVAPTRTPSATSTARACERRWHGAFWRRRKRAAHCLQGCSAGQRRCSSRV